MRFLAPAIGCLLAGLAVSAAGAAVPNPIASLLGPSIGYLQAQSELCGWNLKDKIRATYQKEALIAPAYAPRPRALSSSGSSLTRAACTRLTRAFLFRRRGEQWPSRGCSSSHTRGVAAPLSVFP
jgi:hypothetical protein